MTQPWVATLKGSLWMLGAVLCFTAMAVAVRELSGQLHTFQILAIRNAIGLAVIALLVTRRGWHRVRTTQWPLHGLRSGAHLAGQFAWFYAIGLIPLSTVFAIELTTPLWTAVLALLVLGERLTPGRLVAIVAGIVGVLIILRPGIVSVHPAALIMLAGAVGYGVTHTVTKQLSRTDSSLAILFYMMLMQTLLVSMPAAYSWTCPEAAHWPWLLLVAGSGLAAHYCLIRALLLADAMVVIPMDFLRLPLIGAVGLWLYGETIDPFLLLGSALILGGLLLNLALERRPGSARVS